MAAASELARLRPAVDCAAVPAAFATFDETVYTELADAIGGDDVRAVIERFLSDTARRLGVMRGAAAGGDRERIEFEAHTAKGSAGILGFIRLSHLAEALEQDVAKLDGPAVNARLDALEAEFVETRAITVARLLAAAAGAG